MLFSSTILAKQRKEGQSALFAIAVVRVVQDTGICHTSISNSYMDFFPEGKWDGIEDFLGWNKDFKIATQLLLNFNFHSYCNSTCYVGKKWLNYTYAI